MVAIDISTVKRVDNTPDYEPETTKMSLSLSLMISSSICLRYLY